MTLTQICFLFDTALLGGALPSVAGGGALLGRIKSKFLASLTIISCIQFSIAVYGGFYVFISP